MALRLKVLDNLRFIMGGRVVISRVIAAYSNSHTRVPLSGMVDGECNRRINIVRGYGIGNNLSTLAPRPSANMDPTGDGSRRRYRISKCSTCAWTPSYLG